MSANEEDLAKSQPNQNPGQSLSPYQQGQKGFDQPPLSGGQPQGFGAQVGYGSHELRGQYGGAYACGSTEGGYGQQDGPRQNDAPDRQGTGASFGGRWGEPNPAQGWGPPQPQALTEGWGSQGPSPRHRDPHYHAWRERQNRQFDEDWEAFNRERQTSFDDAFETWRKSRAAKANVAAVDSDIEAAVESLGNAATAVSVKDK